MTNREMLGEEEARMTNQEILERALGQYQSETDDICGFKVAPGLDYDALADQMIAIECEVEHRIDGDGKWTQVYSREKPYVNVKVDGWPGETGPALIIILHVPEEEEDV